MKKFIAAAIIVVAIILVASPIAAGYVLKNVSGEEALNAQLTKLFGGSIGGGGLGYKVVTKSYESDLFSAKSLVAFALVSPSFEEQEIFLIDSDFSFGWFFSESYPFVSLVKTRDKVRLSEDLLASVIGEELQEWIGDGVLLEGETNLIPYFYASGYYASKAVKKTDRRSSFDVAAATIKFSVGAGGKNLDFTLDQPLIDVTNYGERVLIEGIRLKIEGDILDRAGDRKAELSVEKIDATDAAKASNLSLRGWQTAKGSTLDSAVEFSADKIDIYEGRSAPKLRVDKPYAAAETANVDIKLIVEIQDQIQDIQAKQVNNPMAALEIFELIPKLFELFDKGCVFTAKLNLTANDGPVDFFAKLTTDPKVSLPAFSLSETYALGLIKKLIIDVKLSAHKNAIDALEPPHGAYEQLESSGFFKLDGDTLSTDARFENNQWVIGGQEAPFEGLFPSQGGSGYNDFDDYDEDDYAEDYEEYDD
jgi:hypothetical protein